MLPSIASCYVTELFTSWLADTDKKTKIKTKIQDNADLSDSSCGTDVLCLVAFQLDEHGKFIKTTLELPVDDSVRAEGVT